MKSAEVHVDHIRERRRCHSVRGVGLGNLYPLVLQAIPLLDLNHLVQCSIICLLPTIGRNG